MVDKLKEVLASRRFYAAIVTAALIYINSVLRVLDDQQMTTLVGIVSAWIIGESIRSTSPS